MKMFSTLAAAIVGLAMGVGMIGGCEREPSNAGSGGARASAGSGSAASSTPGAGAASGGAAPPVSGAEDRVVVYCSADAVYFQPVLAAFTKSTGIKVEPIFDTEATKTFGLVQRLLNEHEGEKGATGVKGAADVFVSSEAFGMIRLDRAGVLEKYTSEAAEGMFEKVGGWPRMLRAKDGTWYGFARRARVLVYNTKFVKPEEVPTRLAQMTDARWKGRVGIARPQFGTTRGHMAALRMACGESAYAKWLEGLKANDLRLYDGNASVVRAVATGEIHIGLTDVDDVHAGWANKWPLAMTMPGNQVEMMTHNRTMPNVPYVVAQGEPVVVGSDKVEMPVTRLVYPESTLQSPHTVGIVKGGAHPAAARKFVEFMLTREVDEILSSGEAKTAPTFHILFQDPKAAMLAKTTPPELWLMDLDLEEVAVHAEPALKEFERVFGGK